LLTGTTTAVVPGMVTTFVTDVGNEDLGTKTGDVGNFEIDGIFDGTVGADGGGVGTPVGGGVGTPTGGGVGTPTGVGGAYYGDGVGGATGDGGPGATGDGGAATGVGAGAGATGDGDGGGGATGEIYPEA
jgi:hypothetical protein